MKSNLKIELKTLWGREMTSGWIINKINTTRSPDTSFINSVFRNVDFQSQTQNYWIKLNSCKLFEHLI